MRSDIRNRLTEALAQSQLLVEEKAPIRRSIWLRGDTLEVYGDNSDTPVITLPRRFIDEATAIYEAIDNQPRDWHPSYFPLGKTINEAPHHDILAVGETPEACVKALGEQQGDREVEFHGIEKHPHQPLFVARLTLHGSPMELTLLRAPGGWVGIDLS